MKILVTGANGQLGKCLFDLSNETNWDWVFTSRKQLDLTNNELVNFVLASENPDIIVNTAAYTQVDKAETEQDLAFETNHNGIANLASSVKNRNTKIIHISTDYVFEGIGNIPYNESSPVNPNSVYGFTKAAGEKYLLENLYDRSYIVRTAWLYSEYGHNFVKTMLRLGAEKNEINVVDDQLGTPTYARDLASGILRMIEKIEQNDAPTGIYHFANKNITTWFQFATQIMKMAHLNCIVKPITTSQFPTLAKRPAFSALNSDKFESIFNFAVRNWEEALQDCIDRINQS
jgi:dTDP-4-dehydrorhamnose reductase